MGNPLIADQQSVFTYKLDYNSSYYSQPVEIYLPPLTILELDHRCSLWTARIG